MPLTDDDPSSRDQVPATWVEFTIRLGVLGLLLYFSFLLVRPFISIATWSVVLTVALYPVYNLIVGMLGGRRRLAAALLTLLSLLIVIGPATWLVLGLIDSLRILSERLDFSALALPPPREAVKNWPLIGHQIYEVWELASNNIEAALAKVAPLLKPIGSSLIQVAAGAGTGAIKFFFAIIIAGSCIRRHPRWWMPSKNSHAGSLPVARSSSNSLGPPFEPCRAA
jgi:predicted PurR-regulated permease PerM